MKINELDVIKPNIDREKALNLINKTTKSQNLIKHMLASEAAMIEYANHFIYQGKLAKDNVSNWALSGLLHDITYEKDPQNHMHSGADLLKKESVSDYITHAIDVHGNFSGKDQITLLDKILWIAEETTGLVVASTLVLPTKKINDLTLQSLIKKFKSISFAAKINRDNIKSGVERVGLTIEEHLEIVLRGMKKIGKGLEL